MLNYGDINAGGGMPSNPFWDDTENSPDITNNQNATGGVVAIDNSHAASVIARLAVTYKGLVGAFYDIIKNWTATVVLGSGSASIGAINNTTGDISTIQAQVDTGAGDAVGFISVANFPSAPLPGQPINQSIVVDALGFHVVNAVGDPDNFAINYEGKIITNQINAATGTNNTIANLIEVFDNSGTSKGFIPIMVRPGTPALAPTIVAGSGAGIGATATISGTDREGIVSVTTGLVPVALGDLLTATYGTPYALSPVVTFSPGNRAAVVAGVYSQPAPTGFKIICGSVALAASTTYSWSYIVSNL